MGDVTVTYNGGQVQALAWAQRIDSREGLGVWNIGEYSWKVYATTNQYDDINNAYTRAGAQGLPMGSPRWYRCTVTQNRRTSDGFIIITRWSRGTFFSFQRNSPTFNQGLTRQAISHSRTAPEYVRINRGCGIAKTLNVRDCQGFIEKAASEPLMFIDVHVGTSSEQAVQMVEIITAWGTQA